MKGLLVKTRESLPWNPTGNHSQCNPRKKSNRLWYRCSSKKGFAFGPTQVRKIEKKEQDFKMD